MPAHSLAACHISFWASIQAMLTLKDDQEIDKPKLIEKIGEQGVAKLAVAETFFDDFNHGNWGYDKNGLVLIDLDKGPKLWHEYFDGFYFGKRYGNLFRRVALSIDNVIEMQKIYQAMLTKPVPKLHASVDMPEGMYKALLDVFIESCQSLIDTYQAKLSLSSGVLVQSTSSFEINAELKNTIVTLGQKHYVTMSEAEKLNSNRKSRMHF